MACAIGAIMPIFTIRDSILTLDPEQQASLGQSISPAKFSLFHSSLKSSDCPHTTSFLSDPTSSKPVGTAVIAVRDTKYSASKLSTADGSMTTAREPPFTESHLLGTAPLPDAQLQNSKRQPRGEVAPTSGSHYSVTQGRCTT
uniref:Uncharacterized protein n=1 Tax=Oryza glumipatula TaxID=40148 RepID=A0A0E0B875_9ORYZ